MEIVSHDKGPVNNCSLKTALFYNEQILHVNLKKKKMFCAFVPSHLFTAVTQLIPDDPYLT